MNPNIKSTIMDMLPPLVLRQLRVYRKGNVKWKGNFPDWASAVSASTGYDSKAIFAQVVESARAVRDKEALWERDSKLFYHEEYNWPLLACLMTVAARLKGELHVLDFGGAFGSTYMQHRKLLTSLPIISWNIVEQPHIVNCGKNEFIFDALGFFDNIHQAFAAYPINVVLFSSVLQYLEYPYELLNKVLKYSPEAIIIDRTPTCTTGDRITVQHVPKNIYSASYPCRFLHKEKIEKTLRLNRMLTPWFTNHIDPPNFLGIMSLIEKE